MNTTPDEVDDYLYDTPKLLLDDDVDRTPEAIYGYTKNPLYTYPNWVVVRNYNEFVAYIKSSPMPKVISFDHDLADIHYKTFLRPAGDAAKQAAWTEYHEREGDREMTGYDCLKWLADYCHDNAVIFPQILIHTMNTVGYNNMVFFYRSALRNKFIRIN
jgi:hypothetical protein